MQKRMCLQHGRTNLPKRGDDDGESPLLPGSRKKLERGFCANLEQSLGTAFETGSDSRGCHVHFLQSSPLRGVKNMDLLACAQRGS